jgi:hypothetical protein
MLANEIMSIRTTVTKLVTSHRNRLCLKSVVRVKPLLSKGCGRGEIGKHKGLKRRALNHRVTGHPPNSFKHNNYLVDILSDVPLLVIGTEVTL